MIKNILFAVVLFCGTVSASGVSAQVSDEISGTRSSGTYRWKYGYHIELGERELLIRVGIHPVPAPGVSRVQLSRVEPKWEKGIEDVWSDRFALIADGEQYPIRLDVEFSGRPQQHDIIVLPGGGRRSNELTWHIMDTPQTAAHEFGHMLGLYDEYSGGACNPLEKRDDPGSIMTSSPVNGKARRRHFEQFRQWVMEKTGWRNVILQPLNERVLEGKE